MLYVQPGLNGVRLVTHNNKLYSRKWNIFPELPYIITELSLIKENIILNGETYTDDINLGLVRKAHKSDEEIAISYKINYNIFDCIDTSLQTLRLYYIHTGLVQTEKCQSKTSADTYLTK